MAYFRFYLQLLPRQLSEHMGPLGVAGGEPTRQEHLLASCMAASFWCSIGLLLIWRHVIAPAIAAYSARSSSDKVFLSNSFVSLFNAIAAPVLAVLAMRSVPWGDVERVMDMPPDDYAIRAVGVSCGGSWAPGSRLATPTGSQRIPSRTGTSQQVDQRIKSCRNTKEAPSRAT